MKNNALDTSGWREFKLIEHFDIGTGATCKAKDLVQVAQGGIPRISVKGIDNGIQGYFKDIDSKDYRVNENFISFSFLGTCFYHPYKASLDMKVHTIKPKYYTLNLFSGLFLVNVLKNSFRGIYGDQISSSDLKTESIKLPVDSQGNINWHFMEESIKKTKAELEKILQSYKSLKLLATNGGGGVGKEYLLIAYFIIILILQNLKSQNLKKTFWYCFIEILRAYALRMTLPVILSVAKNLRTQNLQKIFRLFQIPNMTRIT